MNTSFFNQKYGCNHALNDDGQKFILIASNPPQGYPAAQVNAEFKQMCRQQCCAAVNAQRLAKESQPLDVILSTQQKISIDFDARSRENINGAKIKVLSGSYTDTYWRLFDNSIRLLSAQDIQTIYNQGYQKIKTLYLSSFTIKTKINEGIALTQQQCQDWGIHPLMMRACI